MKKLSKKEITKLSGDIGMEFVGNVLIAAATCNVAVNAEFPLSGFNGIAMVFYRLMGLPLGAVILVLNIVPALLCLKRIGWRFILKTARCMVMSMILSAY